MELLRYPSTLVDPLDPVLLPSTNTSAVVFNHRTLYVHQTLILNPHSSTPTQIMAPTQAEKSRKISEEIGRQYNDKNFRWPKDYTPAEAAEFVKIRERTFAKREKLRSEDRDTQPSPDDIYKDDGELLENALQTATGIEKYWLWVHREDMICRTLRPEPGMAENYFRTLAHTDCADYPSMKKLCAVIRAGVSPYIPVGSHMGWRYRLSPTNATIWPDDDQVDREDTREFAHEDIVAINLPRGQRIKYTDETKNHNTSIRADDTNVSHSGRSSTNNSDLGNDATGFSFLQLGVLYALEEKHWSDDGKLPENPNKSKFVWSPTDWILVVVIDADNTSGAVWLLQNFEPTVENTSDQYMIDEADPYEWGYFEGELQKESRPIQRAGVKIADKISDLSDHFQWTMDEYITCKYEIRRAVLEERGEGRVPVIVRQQFPVIKEDQVPDVSGLSIGDSN